MEPMQREALLDVFRRSGALLEGHFRLSSGLHSGGYLQCALLLQDTDTAESLAVEIAHKTYTLARRPSVVLSPAIGGIVIGQEVARVMHARAIFAERENGVLVLRRGFTLRKDDRVLVVEDVLTTGGSLREVTQIARAAGADVIGAAAIVDRRGPSPAGSERSNDVDGVPFFALLDIDLATYEADKCPLCAQGLPVAKPGSRAVPA